MTLLCVAQPLCFPAPSLGWGGLPPPPPLTSLHRFLPPYTSTSHRGTCNCGGKVQSHPQPRGLFLEPTFPPHQGPPAPTPGTLTCSQGQPLPRGSSPPGLPGTCGSSWRSWRPCRRNRSLCRTCSPSARGERTAESLLPGVASGTTCHRCQQHHAECRSTTSLSHAPRKAPSLSSGSLLWPRVCQALSGSTSMSSLDPGPSLNRGETRPRLL